MSREAMKQALEALEYISSHYMSLPQSGCEALAALRQALEQPADEPVGEVDSTGMAVIWANKPMNNAKLYTRPQPAAQWVGLTDVEWMNIVNKNQAWFGMRPEDVAHEVCKLTEAKLREKNGGGL